MLTRAQQDELIKLSVDATLALGFTSGVFHVESKYTSHGARLIEVNCRMGGMQARCAPLATRLQTSIRQAATGCLGRSLLGLVFAGSEAEALASCKAVQLSRSWRDGLDSPPSMHLLHMYAPPDCTRRGWVWISRSALLEVRPEEGCARAAPAA